MSGRLTGASPSPARRHRPEHPSKTAVPDGRVAGWSGMAVADGKRTSAAPCTQRGRVLDGGTMGTGRSEPSTALRVAGKKGGSLERTGSRWLLVPDGRVMREH
jgi:hypothetical protein